MKEARDTKKERKFYQMGFQRILLKQLEWSKIATTQHINNKRELKSSLQISSYYWWLINNYHANMKKKTQIFRVSLPKNNLLSYKSNYTETMQEKGWLPVELQPLVVSPKEWMWNPWRPGESPVILPFTWVCPAKDLNIKRAFLLIFFFPPSVNLWWVHSPVAMSWIKWRKPLTALSLFPPAMRATPFRLPPVAIAVSSFAHRLLSGCSGARFFVFFHGSFHKTP